jgi:hypothetical protein
VATRGRRALHRNVHSFAELLIPDELLLDTSFVYEALQPGQIRHRECATFLERAATNKTTFFFNRLLEIELREVAFRGAFARRWGNNWHRHRYDGRTRNAAGRQAAQTMLAWSRFLRARLRHEARLLRRFPAEPADRHDQAEHSPRGDHRQVAPLEARARPQRVEAGEHGEDHVAHREH